MEQLDSESIALDIRSIIRDMESVTHNIDSVTKDMLPPPSIVSIDNLYDVNITVKDCFGYIIVDCNKKIIFKEEVDKYRSVVFINAYNSTFNIQTKLLKLSFVKCNLCSIDINSSIIGVLELYRCKYSKINIKYRVPIIQIDLSERLDFEQSILDIPYVLCASTLINVASLNNKISLTSSIFGEQMYRSI